MSANGKNKPLLFQAPPLDGERETSKKSFSFESKLGDGAFGQVWKIKHKRTGKYYACKQVAKEKVQKMMSQFKREIFIMYELNHPHIVKLYHHFEEGKYFFLVMELAEGGNLFQKLVAEKCFLERQANLFFREILEAIEYLHSHVPIIIHRDIKPENILLDKQGHLKLTDFGWSNYYSIEQATPRYTMCGTVEYLSPEMVKESGHTPAVDIWCLGVLLYEMLCGFTPFKAPVKENLMQNISKAKIKFPVNISPLAKNLISKILEKNPQKRITIEKIKEHGWVTSYNTEPAKAPNEIKLISETSIEKNPSLLDSKLNSFRRSINIIKQELLSRVEICHKNRENIKILTGQVREQLANEKIVEQEILEKKRNLAELEQNIRITNEKISDSSIQLENLACAESILKLQEKIGIKSDELIRKNEEGDRLIYRQSEIASELMVLSENFIDKDRYLCNLKNYSKKIKVKKLFTSKSKQSVISDMQKSCEFLTNQIQKHEKVQEIVETPEVSAVKDLASFIHQRKEELTESALIETKLSEIEDCLSLKEVDVEKIKIGYLDKKSCIIKDARLEKDLIAKQNLTQKYSNSYIAVHNVLKSELKKSREIAKKYMLDSIDLSRAKERIKVPNI